MEVSGSGAEIENSPRRSSETEDESDSSSSGPAVGGKTSSGDIEAIAKMALPVSKRIIDSDKPLSDTWAVWAEMRAESGMEVIFEFDTMRKFHSGWKDLQERRAVSRDRSVCVFRKGVRPVWEDERNKNGGKFLIGIPQASMEYTLDCWFTLVTGITCERFSGCHNLMGAVLNLRAWGSMVTLWNRESTDFKQIYKVKKKLKKLFELPKIKYQAHLYRASSDKKIKCRRSGSPDGSPRKMDSGIRLVMPKRLSDSSSEESSNYEVSPHYPNPNPTHNPIYPLTAYRRFVNNSYGTPSRHKEPLLPQRKSDGNDSLSFHADRLFFTPQYFSPFSFKDDSSSKREEPIPRPPPPKYSLVLGVPSPISYYLPI